MGRKAKPQEQATWDTVSDRSEFSVACLAQLGVPAETARGYLTRWERDGRIALVRQAKNRTLFYAPLRRDATGDGAKPFPQTPENNMWTAMRGLKQFTAQDISLTATHGQTEVSELMAKRYIRSLLEAGYLKVLRREIPGRRRARYRLLKDTGPYGPCIKRVEALADPNCEALTVLREDAVWQRF